MFILRIAIIAAFILSFLRAAGAIESAHPQDRHLPTLMEEARQFTNIYGTADIYCATVCDQSYQVLWCRKKSHPTRAACLLREIGIGISWGDLNHFNGGNTIEYLIYTYPRKRSVGYRHHIWWYSTNGGSEHPWLDMGTKLQPMEDYFAVSTNLSYRHLRARH